ncbi:MAG: HDOD domain-containing protein [Nitrospirae bacterium]|nr:HDOD domain-containing protein [Nitrospirota bacterium]
MDINTKASRVLIVEDEENIRTALSLVVKARYPNFVVDTAADGMDAWEMLERKDFAYDIILSDWNMPRISGEKLLSRIRSTEKGKHLPFLMLTVRKDSESVVYAVKTGVTDYVIKPFDKNSLFQKIEKLLTQKSGIKSPLDAAAPHAKEGVLDSETLSSRVMDIIRSGEIALPAMPQVVFKIEELLGKEDTNIEELAQVVEMDAGMSSKIIAVANSIFYSGFSKCDIVQEAISRLGLQETRELIHMVSNRSLFAMKDARYESSIDGLFSHSIACGAAAKAIAAKLGLDDFNSYFAYGLLHDIGKLLTLQAVSVITKDMKGLNLEETLNIVDSLHCKIGEMLFVKWGFPPIYQFIALNHEDISEIATPGVELAVVHIANLYVRKLGFSRFKDDGEDIVKKASPLLKGLNSGMLDSIASEVNEYVDKMRNLI